jgi:hypothetical protein
MTKATATAHFEEFSIMLEANMVRSDYGVSGSPVWYEPEDIEIVWFEFMGKEFYLKEFPKDFQDWVWQLATDEEHVWEGLD